MYVYIIIFPCEVCITIIRVYVYLYHRRLVMENIKTWRIVIQNCITFCTRVMISVKTRRTGADYAKQLFLFRVYANGSIRPQFILIVLYIARSIQRNSGKTLRNWPSRSSRVQWNGFKIMIKDYHIWIWKRRKKKKKLITLFDFVASGKRNNVFKRNSWVFVQWHEISVARDTKPNNNIDRVAFFHGPEWP